MLEQLRAGLPGAAGAARRSRCRATSAGPRPSRSPSPPSPSSAARRAACRRPARRSRTSSASSRALEPQAARRWSGPTLDERARPGRPSAPARRSAVRCAPGDVVLIAGDVGTGKTTFVRGGVPRRWASTDRVTSPSFTIGQTLRRARARRPRRPLPARDLAGEDPALLADYLTPDRVAFVEWPGARRCRTRAASAWCWSCGSSMQAGTGGGCGARRGAARASMRAPAARRDAPRLRHLDGGHRPRACPATTASPSAPRPPARSGCCGPPGALRRAAAGCSRGAAGAGRARLGRRAARSRSASAPGPSPGCASGSRPRAALAQALGVPLQPGLVAGGARGRARRGTQRRARPLLPLIDARRGQVFAALYRAGEPLGASSGDRSRSAREELLERVAELDRHPVGGRRLGARIARVPGGGRGRGPRRPTPACTRSARCRSAGSARRSSPSPRNRSTRST